MRALPVLLVLAASACDPGQPVERRAAPPGAPAAPAVGAPRGAPVVAPPGTPIATAAPAPRAPVAEDIAWPTSIPWRTWDDGLAEAKRTNRPICLLVYADWCPKCRSLAPAFEDPGVVAASKQLVMIRQDADDPPAWLQEKLGKHGGYVPRLFFLDARGEVMESVTSGNPRFPYFYTFEGLRVLEQNLRKVASG